MARFAWKRTKLSADGSDALRPPDPGPLVPLMKAASQGYGAIYRVGTGDPGPRAKPVAHLPVRTRASLVVYTGLRVEHGCPKLQTNGRTPTIVGG